MARISAFGCEKEAKVTGIQGHPWLHIEIKACLRNIKPLKRIKRNKKNKGMKKNKNKGKKGGREGERAQNPRN